VGRLFGTDGVRGLANGGLTADLTLDLSVAAARVLADRGEFAGHRPVAVVGRDTRISGHFLEAAVVAGLASAGVDVLRLGVLPTPGVAFLTDSLGADLGVMISASHNPMPDNGIKFLARGGHKLDDAAEIAIEQRLRDDWERPVAGGVGRVEDHPTAAAEYAAHLVRTIDHPLVGLRVVLDCAQGAASDVGPQALKDAGADVTAIHAMPDGLNINDGCGSTHLESLRAAVLKDGADVGFALDGDADRCLAVDHTGEVVDGDQILAVLALHLGVEVVAVTVMTNLGFHRLMDEHGIRVVTTPVGDRYVLEALRREHGILGGEQSGHVICLRDHVTGDGLAAALLLCDAVRGRTLGEAAAVMPLYAQAKENVRVARREVPAEALAEADRLNAELNGSGRVLVRASGTEPLIRVLGEAETEEKALQYCARIATLVKRELG
jgi:phosphoglucosamine mutase